MFVALKVQDRTRVTSVAREWDQAEEVLRTWAAEGQLVCPGCEQLLWLRVPQRRRRHFAHRSRGGCPLEHQSAEVLETKAHLYRWLDSKYPGKVQLEVAGGVPGLDRTVDLLVEPKPGRKFAYLVFDRPQREREKLLNCRCQKGVFLHFVHTASALKLQPSGNLLLSASQRDFIQPSEFDACAGWEGFGHLHFFNPGEATLSAYRGLYCVHRPNVYHWAERRSGLLAVALISPRTGEMVFPKDVAAREEWRHKRSPKAPQPFRPEPAPASEPMEVELEQEPAGVEEPPPSPSIDGPYRCEVCGAVTKNWSEATPDLGTCVCRDCVKARRITRG